MEEASEQSFKNINSSNSETARIHYLKYNKKKKGSSSSSANSTSDDKVC